MKHCIKKLLIGLLSFSVVFCNNMTILANTREEDNSPQPEETQEEQPGAVNEEGNLTNEQGSEETPEPSAEPEPSEEPKQEIIEGSSETVTPEPEVTEANTEPEQQEEEPAEEVSYTILAYCFDGTNGIEGYENVDITEKVAAYGDTGALSEDLAPVIDGYSFDVAMINGIYAGGLRYNAYVSEYDWTSFETVADENHAVTVSFTYHKDEPEIIEEPEPEYKYHFEYDDSRVHVIADANNDAKIPADAQLYADYLVPGSPEYQDAVNQLLDGETQDHKTEFELYDIYFLSGNRRIELESGSVDVTLSFKQAVAPSSENGEISAVEVVHVDEETGAEVISDDITTNSEGEIEEISFTSDSFSPFGVKYTVDYTYDGYTWSMTGGTEIYLSELFAELGIYEEAANVTYVEFSDNNLISVTQVLGNWLLTSLQAFDTEELLTITMGNGDKYLIEIKDNQVGEVDYITDFVTNVSITHSDGSAVSEDPSTYPPTLKLRTDETYSVSLSFKENGESKQFPNSDGAVNHYQLPTGFSPVAASGTMPIIIDGASAGTLSWSVDSSGLVTVTWPDPMPSEVIAAGNVAFNLSFTGTFSKGNKELEFGGGVEKKIDVTDQSKVSVTKSGSYDKNTDKITYTLTVISEGSNTDVVLTDTLIGGNNSALSYSQNEPVFTSSTGKAVEKTGGYNSDGKGFNYTINSMSNGETITVTYTADVNYDKLTGKGTAEQTGNKVTVKSNEDAGTEGSHEVNNNFANNISYSSATKTGESQGTVITEGEKTYRQVKWIAVINPEKKSKVGTITDTIKDNASAPMVYDTSINPTIAIDDGRAAEVEWSNFTVDTSNKSWSYSPSDTDAHQYTITYYTKVDITGITSMTSVNNKITVDTGAETEATATVTPSDSNKLGILKEVQSYNSGDTVSWVVTVNVPALGVNSLVVDDVLPYAIKYGSPNSALQDSLVGTPEISFSSKVGDEHAEISEETESVEGGLSAKKIVFTFYKDAGVEHEGLNEYSENRTITISIKTKINEEWYNLYNTNQYALNTGDHTNSAKIRDHSELSSQATVKPIIPSIGKTAESVDNNNVIFKYYFKLVTLPESEFTITDITDTELLKPSSDGYQQFVIKDGPWGDVVYSTPLPYVMTENGFTLTVTQDAIDHIKQRDPDLSGTYYIYYYMVPKSDEALEQMKLIAARNGGVFTVNNTASISDVLTSETVSSSYEVKENLTKEKLSVQNDGKINPIVQYRITANPNALDMDPQSNTLILTDDFTNLSIKYDSIKVKDKDGQDITSATWNTSGTTATFIIPDEKKVVITYSATVLKSGITYKNTATLMGQSVSTPDAAETFDNSQSASGTTFEIFLLKHEAGYMNRPIQGVKFKLYKYTNDEKTSWEPVKDGSKSEVIRETDANGMIKFSGKSDVSSNEKITFYSETMYFVQEVSAPSGFVQDDTKYEFRFNNDGTKVDYANRYYFNGDTLRVSNSPVDHLKITKTVVGGGDEVTNKIFKISVLGPDGYYYIANGWKYLEPTYIEFTANQTITIDNIPAGTYVIEEKTDEADIDGYRRITTGTGTVTVAQNQTAEKEITNTYEKEGETTAKLSVTKALTGDTYAGQEKFEFSLERVSGVEDGDTMPTTSTVEVEAGQTAEFDPITFTKQGTYTYSIKEIAGTTPGMTYDTEPKYAKVVVKQTGSELTSAVTYGTSSDPASITDPSLTVTNKYGKTTFKPEITKKIEGTGAPDASFVFTIAKKTGGPRTKDSDVLPTNTTATATLTGTITSANAEFADITYTEPGVYTYEINETTQGGIAGMTYSSEKVTVTVTVTEGADGKLTASAVYSNSNASDTTGKTFTNIYTKPSGTATLSVTKKVTGNTDKMSADEKTAAYTFTLARDPDNEKTSDVLPDPTTISTNGDATGTSGAVATFGAITYTEEGTYYYTITETPGSMSGMTYDTSTKYAKVFVTKTGSELTPAVTYSASKEGTYSDSLTVINKFGKTAYTPSVTKVLDGDTAPAETYSFTLSDNSEDKTGEILGTTTATVSGSGIAKFGEITYTNPGTYKYEISETAGSTAGMAYSASKVTVTVTVTKDDSTGLLSVASAVYSGGDTDNHEIKNIYTQPTGLATLSVTKALTGDTYEGQEEFEFTLGRVSGETDGDTMPSSLSAKTIAGNSVNFDAITFTKPGTYIYSITESAGTTPGMTYDTTSKYAKVVVEVDGNNLKSTVTYGTSQDADSIVDTSLTITNKYGKTTYAPQVKKIVEGINVPAEEYHFTLEDKSADTSGEVLGDTTAKVTGAGTAAFGEITYTKPGTYVYEITETPGNTAGMEYSTEKVTVTVTVEENSATGALTATAAVTGGDTNDNELRNIYTGGETQTAYIIKTDREITSGSYLGEEGVQFQVYKANFSNRPDAASHVADRMLFRKMDDESGTAVYKYTGTTGGNNTIATATAEGDTLETGSNGAIKLTGLPVSTVFTAVETYNLPGYESCETEVPQHLTEVSNDTTLATAISNHSISSFVDEAVSSSLSVFKNFSDGNNLHQSETIKVTLYKVVSGTESVIEEVSLDAASNWTYKWTDLLLRDESGNLISYKVKETSGGEKYVVSYSPSDTAELSDNKLNDITILNSADIGDLKVTKTVSGSNGDKTKAFNFTVTLSDKTITGVYGDITFEKGVASFTLKHGEIKSAKGIPAGITYTVVEKEANTDDYKTTYTNAKGIIKSGTAITATVTNTKKTPKSTTRTIKLKKVWDDSNNASGTRPSSIKVHLLADGIDTGKTAELSAANNWIYTWLSLPLNNAEGNPINYTVVEEEVEGYTNTVRGSMTSGFTITNSNKKKSPKTDDVYHIFKWTVSFITSMVVSLIAALLLRRKK